MPDLDAKGCRARIRDITAGACATLTSLSRETIHKSARCQFRDRMLTQGELSFKATSTSERDIYRRARVCVLGAYFPPDTPIQRSKHCSCQTQVLGQKHAQIAGHEPLPMGGCGPRPNPGPGSAPAHRHHLVYWPALPQTCVLVTWGTVSLDENVCETFSLAGICSTVFAFHLKL